MSKCDRCPLASQNQKCKGERPSHKFACTSENRSESFIRSLIDEEVGTVSLTNKVVNLGKAAVKFIKNGGRRTSETEYKERLSICLTCEQYDDTGKTCKLCGCSCNGIFLNKLRYSTESCPLGKWGAIEE